MLSPDLSKVAPFYHRYINLVHVNSVSALFDQHQHSLEFLQQLPADKWAYRYAPDKWSIKEMVQHIIDAERIFSYRALCFARQDKNSLPSFDENGYAAASKADNRTRESLLEELSVVQQSSRLLFLSFDEEQLQSEGVANSNSIQVIAIGFILVGHTVHHTNIIKERYL